MATTQIRLSDDNLLGEYISLDKFQGVIEQRLAVGPDLMAMLIRDGQIAQAAPGGHFSIGGVWRSIKDAIGGKHALRMLIADLKPFQLTVPATALTKDNVPVAGEFTIELQVNPERPAGILGLMKEHSAVTKTSILSRLSPHIGERVLSATIRQVDALELRGNIGLQDKVQADAMKEVERIAGDLGLLARVVSVTWALNEEEQALVVKRQLEREQEALEREFQILTREVARDAESTVISLKTDLDVEKVKAANEDELRRFILANELGFIDARETGIRVQQMAALKHELDLNRTQRLDGLQAQLEAERHLIEMARTGGQRRDVEMDLATREKQHQLAIVRIDQDILAVQREGQLADGQQGLALGRLKLQFDREEQADRIKTLRDLQDVDLDGKDRETDITIKGGDAEHRRAMDAARLESETLLARIKALGNATPEQIIAIQAGFSPEVANVMVEQAKARAAEGVDRIALMREMVQQANEAKVSSEAQARHLFDSGMQGATGVAQGVGMAAAGAGMGGMGVVPIVGGTGLTECPNCHTAVPITDRFCENCGRQMRQ